MTCCGMIYHIQKDSCKFVRDFGNSEKKNIFFADGGKGTINVPPLVSIGLSHFVVDKINWNLYPGLIALLGEVHAIMSRV